MRIITLLLLLALFTHTASAQQKAKYWIFLTDKLDGAGKHTLVEAGHLANKAIQRRALRGDVELAPMFALQDAPISPVYDTRLQERGINIEHRSRWLNAVTAWLTDTELQSITALPYVRATRPVAHLALDILSTAPVSPVIPEQISSNCPSARFGNSCDQLDLVNAIPPIQRGINGKGVVLGLIDTEFHSGSFKPFSHRSLQHIRDTDRFGGVRNFTRRDQNQLCPSADRSAHGLAVASIAVGYHEGRLIGPGHGATVYGAITECVLYERNIEEDNFVAAVEWMESEGVDVITASLGYSDFDIGQESYGPEDIDGDTGLTTIAMDWAASRGVIPINSAGNSGPGSQTITTPSDGHSVIAIGAVWPSDGRIAFFSSRGPTADGRIKPDVSAQGVAVDYASGSLGYGRGGGTSFSAPMVAGIVTQILQVNPNLGPKDVWRILTATADRSDAPNNTYGWGIVDADAAIMSAIALNRSGTDLQVPDYPTVHAPYPNPFQGVVHFTVDAVEPVSYARLAIIDVLGREVGIVYEGAIRAGGMPIQFDGSYLPPGVYAYTLDFEGRIQSGKMTRSVH